MKDPVFVGKDVAEAVRVASRTLGLPEGTLRYVVLDRGQPGGRGLSATVARIAVLIERAVDPGDVAPAHAAGDTAADGDWESGRGRRRRGGAGNRQDSAPRKDDPAAAVQALVAEMARAAGVELRVELGERRDDLDVRLEGAGTEVFFEPTGKVVEALEHLIERLYGQALEGRRVRLRCAGYREYRDELLRQQALDLAGQVRSDGISRTTGPLNSYERRIIHVVLESEPGVRTFSVGEGRERRVTVATVESSEAVPGESAAAKEVPVQDEARRDEPTVEPRVAVFDARLFDRPPQGGGSSELM